MLQHISFLIVIVQLLAADLTSAQSVAVSIPDTAVVPASALILTVQISDVTGLEVQSVLMKLSYSTSVLLATNVSVDGTIASGSIFDANLDTPGRILAGVYGAFLEGSGTVFFLEFVVVGGVGDTTVIQFDEFLLNEGIPSAVTHDGIIRIRPSGAGPIVWVRASEDSVENGQHFETEIWAENVTNLGSYRFSVGFNTSLVRAISARNGPFLGSTGRTTSETMKVIDNIDGVVTLAYSSEGLAPGPSGGGILGIIEFEAGVEASGTAEMFSLKAGPDHRQ